MSRRLLTVLGPGILIAATGVGAGDLATAGLAGSVLKTAVLWAALLGAFIKFVINEGIGRHQLATGDTLLEGAVRRLGRGVAWLFLPYLLIWSLLIPTALMSACGVAFQALVPVFDDPGRGKIVFGIAHSAVGVFLVLWGGFRLFERVMSVCIVVMVVTVTSIAVMVAPPLTDILQGLFVPSIPDAGGEGLTWTVALMGGIGGTITVLCYGYWIREEGREGPGELRACRIDLGVGYLMTALFGISMVLIASNVEVSGGGASFIVQLGDSLGEAAGPVGQWAFLIGAWCAIFSSLLGVWQAIPYLFADFCQLVFAPDRPGPVNPKGRPYRIYLLAMATVPAVGLLFPFKEVQKFTGVLGALCMPLLAAGLLILNSRKSWMGELRSGWGSTIVLGASLIFFGWLLILELSKHLL